MADVLFVIMRWVHFASMATLIGGILYWRFVLTPALGTVSPDAAKTLGSKAAAGYRPLAIAAICGLVLSGSYNLLTNPGHSVTYHMLLGAKLMLALHVFAVALLITQPENPRRARLLAGALVSSLVILAIAAYLMRIF